jgi:3-carboxy-cis,cis-muconate cycloisomerase
VAAALTPALGRQAAHDLVGRCARRATETGHPFASVLGNEPQVQEALDPTALQAALDPVAATASADALVERALSAHDRVGRRQGTAEERGAS